MRADNAETEIHGDEFGVVHFGAGVSDPALETASNENTRSAERTAKDEDRGINQS